MNAPGVRAARPARTLFACGTGRAAISVQGWQNMVLGAMSAVVLAGGIGVSVLLAQGDRATRTLTDQIGPAIIASYRLQASLRDQETAVRGYLISADSQFLEPYDTGTVNGQRARADLRRFEADRPDLVADLDGIEAAADRWRRDYADAIIASVTAGAPGPPTPGSAQRGKADFDELRALFDIQSAHLTGVRNALIDRIDVLRAWRNGVLVAMVVTFVLTVVLLAVLLRRSVVGPLAALAASCRRIAGGNFAERAVASGPSDIRGIAVDVDNMRQRIVGELDASRAAADTLDKQAEELRRSNAELEQFAYVASHDLQEPLRKVASFCQLLDKRYGDQLDERGSEYIGYAVDGAKRMQVLINDLLTFSRVGRAGTAAAAVSLDALLDAAVGNLSTAIDEAGAVIVRPESALPTVTADPTLISMLWQNLLGNAIKFRREGVRPRIEIDWVSVDAGAVPDKRRFVSFSVSDNGIGIAPEFAEKVFVIFQRLHGRDAYGGTGIGLALCKKVVEFHGGTIMIDPSHTGGTRFVFTLPVGSDQGATSMLGE